MRAKTASEMPLTSAHPSAGAPNLARLTDGRTRLGTEAFRGDAGWANYRVEADVKLYSTTSTAGVILRVGKTDYLGYGDRFYECYLTTRGILGFRRRYLTYDIGGGHHLDWEELGSSPVSNPREWHRIRVDAMGSMFKCYLDNEETPRITVTSTPYPSGKVGLRVDQGAALFDNVTVLRPY